MMAVERVGDGEWPFCDRVSERLLEDVHFDCSTSW